ncbi:hypothetical protein HY493_03010 [Candidatus Woesearchaeota archaeon]|nr:hypothetical protein [Candidatus Woesearchaeota archaeon]
MDWKQLSVLMVLALFVMSAIPAVFADEGSDDGSDDAGNETEIESGTEVDAASEGGTDGTDDRSGPRDRMKEAREKLLKAEKRALEARKDVREAKRDFQKARAKLHSGGATLADKQEFLLASVDKIIELLNGLKEKVEASEVEDKDEILADIDAAIENMTEAQATVEALDPETATREELRAAAKELQDAWKDARHVLKRGAGHVVNKRVGNVVERMEHLAEKLDRILAHLGGKGYDVSVATDLKAEFDVKLASAKTHWESSKELFNGEDKDVQAANDEMKLAGADLKEAHRILNEIVKAIRGSTESGALEEAEDAAAEAPEAEEAGDADDGAAEDADDSTADDAEGAGEADDEADDADEADEADNTDADEAEDADEDETGVEVNASVEANVTV